MTIHFSTLTNSDQSNNGRAAFVNTLMAEAGGSAAVTPVDQSYNFPVSGTITFNGMVYTLPNNATQWTWYQTTTVAWDDDGSVLVIYSDQTPGSTVAPYNSSYASCFVYVIIAGGHLWWGSGPHNTTIANAFNIGTGTTRAAADTTRAMLTPLIADGIDMTPLCISQNFVIDTAGTTVTDTAGNTFVSLGNLLYIMDTAASEPAGTSVTCRVGSVSTLPAGAQATVTNSGTLNDVILDFGIPAGAAGHAGTNDQAATITVGTVSTLPAGSNATVTNSGTLNDIVLDFGIPQGADGPKGDKGDNGSSASVTVGKVTELPAGSTPTVTNSGTTTDAVLDFGIPAGAAGPKSDKGDKGDKGDGVTEFGTDSIAIGTTPDTSATTTNTVAVGDGASTVNDNCVAIGTTATTGGTGNTIIGSGAVSKAQNSTVVGYQAAATTTDGNSGGTAVGYQASADDFAMAFGACAHALKHASIAIGINASGNGRSGVAIGDSATVTGQSSVALGSGATASAARVVSVGSDTLKRRVVNVADPTAAQDAATKHYVDSHAASGGYTLPAATASTLGGVKVGRGITVAADGTISASGAVTPAAAIADLTAAPTAGDFNALLNALRAAGLMDRPTTTPKVPAQTETVDVFIGDSTTAIWDTAPEDKNWTTLISNADGVGRVNVAVVGSGFTNDAGKKAAFTAQVTTAVGKTQGKTVRRVFLVGLWNDLNSIQSDQSGEMNAMTKTADAIKSAWPGAQLLYIPEVAPQTPYSTSMVAKFDSVINQVYTLFEGKGFNVAHDWLDWMPDGKTNGYMHDTIHPNAKGMNVAAHKIREWVNTLSGSKITGEIPAWSE